MVSKNLRSTENGEEFKYTVTEIKVDTISRLD